MQETKQTQKGFTLVELSIVIVIIGLIVAGVVAGQSLVREAQLRSIISEQENIKSSLNSFRLQYNAIPGDMSNAGDYWAAGCLAAGGSGATVDAECNGDGDRRIEEVTTGSTTFETYMAWTHLSLANLYPGAFIPGTSVVGSNTNTPASKFSGARITLVYDDATSDATAGDGATSGGRDAERNIILFGGVSTEVANGTVLSAPQAFALDTKADDGSPVTGVGIAVGSAAQLATNCIDTAGTVPLTDDVYNLDATDATPCAIAFGI